MLVGIWMLKNHFPPFPKKEIDILPTYDSKIGEPPNSKKNSPGPVCMSACLCVCVCVYGWRKGQVAIKNGFFKDIQWLLKIDFPCTQFNPSSKCNLPWTAKAKLLLQFLSDKVRFGRPHRLPEVWEILYN